MKFLPKFNNLRGWNRNVLAGKCNQSAIENDLYFLLDCPNYEELRNDTFNPIVEIDNINLKHGNKIKLIFYAPTPQNGQAHSKYFSAV